jgi:flagellar protein FlbD
MIEVTHLDGASAVVNLDLIERIERTPDTLIVMANGTKLLVRETPEELVERACAFKRGLFGVQASS